MSRFQSVEIPAMEISSGWKSEKPLGVMGWGT